MKRALAVSAAAAAVVALGIAPTVALASDAPEPFVISGGSDGILFPGASVALDLEIFNPNDGLLRVRSLSARIDSVRTIGQGSCTVEDFRVDNVGDLRRVEVPPGDSDLLSELGLSTQAMPRVRMLNTDYNQDGCKQARVRLVYKGYGHTAETGGGEPTTGGGDNLPGTGASQAPWWIAAAGLGIVGLGAGALRTTRRSKGEGK